MTAIYVIGAFILLAIFLCVFSIWGVRWPIIVFLLAVFIPIFAGSGIVSYYEQSFFGYTLAVIAVIFLYIAEAIILWILMWGIKRFF